MELAIVVPVLNEVARIKPLMVALGRQRQVEFELVFSDGGSTDGTVESARELAGPFGFPVRVIRGTPGRGVQLNRGAKAARADVLLFLHVDSRFDDPLTLRRSLDALQTARQIHGDSLVAGHFRLRFNDAPEALLQAMRFWEIKARLHRFGCNHGDQGLMMVRRDFESLGGYPELMLFEDTLMAERIKEKGRLILLPAELATSARRFAVEGLRQRHTLNAILMTCHCVGLEDFFRRARGHYRLQRDSGRLVLTPFLEALAASLDALPARKRREVLRRGAAFVRTQAWQLLLALRVRQGRWTVETDPERVEKALARFDRIYNRLTDNPIGLFFAGLLLRLWLGRQKRLWRQLDHAEASH